MTGSMEDWSVGIGDTGYGVMVEFTVIHVKVGNQ